MVAYFLDKDLNQIPMPLALALSFEWHMRFFEAGTFRAVFSSDVSFTLAAREASYLCTVVDGIVRCGRIHKVHADADRVEVSGEMLECILSDRVIDGLLLTGGEISTVVTGVVKKYSRDLPLVIAEDSSVIEDADIIITEWENLEEWVHRTLKPYGASYTVSFDPDAGTFVFRVACSRENESPVHVSSYGGISEAEYEQDSRPKKNVVYVVGGDGKHLCVDLSNGEAKRELYRKVSDLTLDYFDTDADYERALYSRGVEILAEHNPKEHITCTFTDSEMHPVVGKDYYLGDICSIFGEWTESPRKMRLVGADELYKSGGRTTTLLFDRV